MFIKIDRKGQSTLEYGILIAVVVGALIAMSIYMKRGLQGRLKSSSDDVGEQYSPGYTTSNYTTTMNSTTSEILSNGSTTTNISQDYRSRTGNETVAGFANESWDASW